MTDTSSAQARSGRDIQGIPWDRLQITRQNYRQTRIQQYKNYENIASSGERMNKVSAYHHFVLGVTTGRLCHCVCSLLTKDFLFCIEMQASGERWQLL